MDEMMDEMVAGGTQLVWLGVLLAVLGNIVIAAGFLVQKIVHNATSQRDLSCAQQTQHTEETEETDETEQTEHIEDGIQHPLGSSTTTNTIKLQHDMDMDPELAICPDPKPNPNPNPDPELGEQEEKQDQLGANHSHNRNTPIQPLAYLSQWKWWIGLLLLCIGEVCNAFAYAFVSGIVVPPLGALALILIVILSCLVLKEHISILHWIGVALVAIGVVLVGIYAPRNEIADGPLSDDELWELIKQPQFYATLISILVIILGLVILIHVKPSWRSKTPWVLALISGLIGSIKSRAFKCIAQMARDSLSQNITTALFWVMIITMVITILLSIYFVNMGLRIYDQAVFLPMYFVVFVSFSVMTSILLYNEFEDPVSGNIAAFSVGLGLILLGAIGLSSQSIPSWCRFVKSQSS